MKWSVNDVDGGNAALGTISSSGLYVTPYPTPAVSHSEGHEHSGPDQVGKRNHYFCCAAGSGRAGAPGGCGSAHASHQSAHLRDELLAASDPKHEAPKVAQEVRLPLNRWGGDGYTLYNYKLDVSDLGDDWFFEIAPNTNTKYPDESEFNSQVIGDRAAGAKTLVSVPGDGLGRKIAHARFQLLGGKVRPATKDGPLLA